MATNAATISSDEIYVGSSTGTVLTDYLDGLESDVSNKAASNHSHTDLENAIEGLEDGKAEAVHTHEMSAINGLTDALAELEEAISSVLNGGGAAGVAPMLVASMHLGKLDNNSGAENSSSTRICSDPIAVAPGNSYYQVNDKGVNMYVLLYDEDELFVEYMGSFASGAEIPVTNANAAYMRLGSLLGEYDLTNEFRIYDVDPESGDASAEPVDAYSKDESDARYAPAAHTHDGYAAADHAHGGYAASSHTHTADDITGLPSSVDAYSRTESDNRYATASHTHSGYAAEGHTHSGYAASTHSHTEYAASGHTHTASAVGAAASNHTHTPASIGAAASSHTHSGYASSSHDHDDDYAAKSHTHHPANIGALSSSGGTIDGALTVMLDSIFNGVLNTQKIQPKDSGSYSIGTADNRFYSTYLRVNPNVSSDRRCKRDIAALNVGELAEFVNKLAVVSYNYTDDAADEEKKIGLIAQDVIGADPEIARFFVEQSENGFYSLRPADFVFPLIAAVQKLSAKIAILEAK